MIICQNSMLNPSLNDVWKLPRVNYSITKSIASNSFKRKPFIFIRRRLLEELYCKELQTQKTYVEGAQDRKISQFILPVDRVIVIVYTWTKISTIDFVD